MIYNGYSTDNKSNHQNEEKTYLHSHEHILSMYKEKKCSRKPKKNKKRQNCQKTTELSKTRLTHVPAQCHVTQNRLNVF